MKGKKIHKIEEGRVGGRALGSKEKGEGGSTEKGREEGREEGRDG